MSEKTKNKCRVYFQSFVDIEYYDVAEIKERAWDIAERDLYPCHAEIDEGEFYRNLAIENIRVFSNE